MKTPLNAKIRLHLLLISIPVLLAIGLTISVIAPFFTEYISVRRIGALEKQSKALASEKEKVKGSTVEYISNEILVKVKDKVSSIHEKKRIFGVVIVRDYRNMYWEKEIIK